MKEENWNVGSVDGDPASLSEFLAVLSDVTDLRFTAKFSTVSNQMCCFATKLFIVGYS